MTPFVQAMALMNLMPEKDVMAALWTITSLGSEYVEANKLLYRDIGMLTDRGDINDVTAL